MRHARLVAMNHLGMTIEGNVTVVERLAFKSKTHAHAVRWIVKHVGAPAVLDAQKLKERSVRHLAAAAASGFSQEDDDKIF